MEAFGSMIGGRDALPLAGDRRHAGRPFPSLQASAILTSADCAVEEVAGASDDHSSWRTPVTIILILGLCAVLYMLWLLFKIGRASCRKECVSTCRSRWSPYH